MRKYITVVASFCIMLCLGGIYAWSFFVSGLKEDYGFSSTQTQVVFGVLVGIFPIATIVASMWEKKIGVRWIAVISAICVTIGYLLAGQSGGSFYQILAGIGVFGGIGTGFGYIMALTTPVKWFPEKKGLVTGIAAAGFGISAVILSNLAEALVNSGYTILQIFTYLGIGYGSIILLLAFFLSSPVMDTSIKLTPVKQFLSDIRFYKLFFGILCGTFAGLLIIGNLKPIGAQFPVIDSSTLVLGISIFALTNFAGRIIWGAVSDYIGASWSIFLALTAQAIAIFSLGFFDLTSVSYLVLAGAVGFNFGANFVLFAKETAQEFGVSNLSSLYPYVFLGYGVSGILGPITGGYIFDLLADYTYATFIAAAISFLGAITFLDFKGIFGKKEVAPAS